MAWPGAPGAVPPGTKGRPGPNIGPDPSAGPGPNAGPPAPKPGPAWGAWGAPGAGGPSPVGVATWEVQVEPSHQRSWPEDVCGSGYQPGAVTGPSSPTGVGAPARPRRAGGAADGRAAADQYGSYESVVAVVGALVVDGVVDPPSTTKLPCMPAPLWIWQK